VKNTFYSSGSQTYSDRVALGFPVCCHCVLLWSRKTHSNNIIWSNA